MNITKTILLISNVGLLLMYILYVTGNLVLGGATMTGHTQVVALNPHR